MQLTRLVSHIARAALCLAGCILALLACSPAPAAALPACGSTNSDGVVNRAVLVLDLVNSHAPPATGPSIAFKDKRDLRHMILEYQVRNCEFTAKQIDQDLKLQRLMTTDADGVALDTDV